MNFWIQVRELLYSREWVVIPGLGAFLYQRLHARVEGDLLVSPYQRIIFRRSIRHDDGDLIQYLAQTASLDPEQIKGIVRMEVDRIEKELEQYGVVTIPHFGLLIQDKLGNLSLLAEAGDRLDRPAELPLMDFVIQRKEVSRLQKGIKKASWAVASGLIALMILAPFFWTGQDNPAGEEAGWRAVPETTLIDSSEPKVLPPTAEEITVTEPQDEEPEAVAGISWNIVAGSFSTQARAQKYLQRELKRYSQARIQSAPNGNYRVIVHTFASEQETRVVLEEVRRQVPDAWIQKLEL